MRSCEEYEELASAWMDGVLPEEDRGALLEHMARCPACRGYFADQAAIHGALRQSLEAAPEGFSAGVMDLVRQTPQEQRPKVIRLRAWRRWAAVAACCAVAALGLWRLNSAKKDAVISTDAVSSQADSGGATPRCAADGETTEEAYGGIQPEAALADGADTSGAEADLPVEEAASGMEGKESLDLFAQIPGRFDGPGQGAALYIDACGGFSGTLADGTRFSGAFSEPAEIEACVYAVTAASVTLETPGAFRLEEGAECLIYLPGADAQSLPEELRTGGGSGWGVYFLGEKLAFTCSSESE